MIKITSITLRYSLGRFILVNKLSIQVGVIKIWYAAKNVKTLRHLKRLLHVAAQRQHHFKQ